MKPLTIPKNLADYISNTFNDASFVEIRKWKAPPKDTFYEVDVSYDDSIYSLQFNEDGTLLREVAGEHLPEEGLFSSDL